MRLYMWEWCVKGEPGWGLGGERNIHSVVFEAARRLLRAAAARLVGGATPTLQGGSDDGAFTRIACARAAGHALLF